MKFLKNLLFIFLLLFGINSKGQIVGNNLVNNSSFEEYFSCPISTGELYKSKYWWGYSTDYYNTCSLSSGIPMNGSGFQFANIGNAYAGFIIYNKPIQNPFNYREYIKTKLKTSLINNRRYCTSININLAEYSYNNNSYIELDTISMLFTKNQVEDTILPICYNCAQINKSILLIDTANWLKINGSFIATGGENYLSIGNFQNLILWPTGVHGVIYLYIDDVSVCECAYNINLGNDTNLCEGKRLALNAILPDATYIWQDGSSNATYEVKQAGTYWVRAYIAEYDITTSDTIVISYSDCNIPKLFIPNSFTPNGDGLNDKFEYGNAAFFDIKTYIYNRWGQLIYEGENTDYWDGSYKDKLVQMDDYNYSIEATYKTNNEVVKYSGKVTVVK
jgi:gliding motility-associated-like protein